MNPIGISMMYVAEDPETARAETIDTDCGMLSIGRWTTLVPLRVLDLVALPLPPGIFAKDSDSYATQMLIFLQDFRGTIVEPVHGHSRTEERLEYVPSQIVTEYLRLAFRDSKGSIQGVRYPSARKHRGINLVFFFGQDAIEGIPLTSSFKLEPTLRLLDFTHQKIKK